MLAPTAPSTLTASVPPGEPPLACGLDVRDLTITYRNGHTALADATFFTPSGSITALVGINGSGKSTLFKAIMGLERPAKGSVHVLRQSVKSAIRQNLVAYVPQNEEVDWDFPVLVQDVVMMGRYGHMGFLRIPKQADHEAVELALRRVNLWDLRHRQIGELSGGQKKRAFLARALAQEAQVILLDEPFTGVDVKTEDAIIELLKALRDEGCVILVSTHNLGSVPEFCDRTVLVKNTVLDFGPTSLIFTPANLEKTFSGVLRHFDLPPSVASPANGVVGIMTDDERPLIFVDGRSSIRGVPSPVPPANTPTPGNIPAPAAAPAPRPDMSADAASVDRGTAFLPPRASSAASRSTSTTPTGTPDITLGKTTSPPTGGAHTSGAAR